MSTKIKLPNAKSLSDSICRHIFKHGPMTEVEIRRVFGGESKNIKASIVYLTKPGSILSGDPYELCEEAYAHYEAKDKEDSAVVLVKAAVRNVYSPEMTGYDAKMRLGREIRDVSLLTTNVSMNPFRGL